MLIFKFVYARGSSGGLSEYSFTSLSFSKCHIGVLVLEFVRFS